METKTVRVGACANWIQVCRSTLTGFHQHVLYYISDTKPDVLKAKNRAPVTERGAVIYKMKYQYTIYEGPEVPPGVRPLVVDVGLLGEPGLEISCVVEEPDDPDEEPEPPVVVVVVPGPPVE